jgi:hypothetical protein
VPPAAPAAAEAEEPVEHEGRSRTTKLLTAAGILLLAVGGIFAWNKFKSAPAPKPAAATPAQKTAAPAPKPAATEPVKSASPTPSETLNKLAHAPAEAINKAQEAIAARRANGQARIDAAVIGEDVPDKPLIPPPGATAGQTPSNGSQTGSTTTTTVAPGVTATLAVDAAPDASAPFRSFVANAKVSGVFQGKPARAVINGRLVREGEVVDAGLGVTFAGIDSGRHHLVFKDKVGATVLRRF